MFGFDTVLHTRSLVRHFHFVLMFQCLLSLLWPWPFEEYFNICCILCKPRSFEAWLPKMSKHQFYARVENFQNVTKKNPINPKHQKTKLETTESRTNTAYIERPSRHLPTLWEAYRDCLLGRCKVGESSGLLGFNGLFVKAVVFRADLVSFSYWCFTSGFTKWPGLCIVGYGWDWFFVLGFLSKSK